MLFLSAKFADIFVNGTLLEKTCGHCSKESRHFLWPSKCS